MYTTVASDITSTSPVDGKIGQRSDAFASVGLD